MTEFRPTTSANFMKNGVMVISIKRQFANLQFQVAQVGSARILVSRPVLAKSVIHVLKRLTSPLKWSVALRQKIHSLNTQ